MTKKLALIAFIAAGAIAATQPWPLLRSMTTSITLHTWGTGDRPRAVDLNGNFTALNNGKVGGGVQLVNADVASTAAIAHSKLATPALLPKAWAMLSANCTGSTTANTACTVGDSSQLNITTSGVTGFFRGNLGYTPANANFAVLVTPRITGKMCTADTYATTAPHFLIKCYDDAGAIVDAMQFTVLVMDS